MRTIIVCLLIGLTTIGVSAQEAKQPDPEKVLADLLKRVKQKSNIEARANAIMELAEFGPKALPALPEFRRKCADALAMPEAELFTPEPAGVA